MKLESELRDSFMAEAAADKRPASQIVREMMRKYVKQRSEAREYKEFLRAKVEAGRADFRAGRIFTNEEVQAKFAARRAATLHRLETSE